MRRTAIWLVCATLASLVLLAIGTPDARAIKPFKDQFDAKYVKSDSTDPKEAAFFDAVRSAGCNLCHVGGFRDRQYRNEYGAALSKRLDHHKDDPDVDGLSAEQKQQLVTKIQAALDEVAGQKSSDDSPDAPTFGELIAAGKLPAKVVKRLPDSPATPSAQ